jgi:hypothetical protein
VRVSISSCAVLLASAVLAAAPARASTVEVAIDSDPPGAEVSVDDAPRPLGRTPLALRLEPGEHRVRLRLAGFEPIERAFLAAEGEPVRLAYVLQRSDVTALLRVRANVKDVRLLVDGRPVAPLPGLDAVRVDAGRRVVAVEKERYTRFARTLDLPAGRTVDVEARLALSTNPFSWRGWTAIGLGAAGIAIATTSATWLRSKGNAEYRGSAAHARYRDLTYAGYGTGAGLLAAAGSLLLWEFLRDAVDPRDRVTP